MVNDIKGTGIESVVQSLGNAQQADKAQQNRALNASTQSSAVDNSTVTITNTAETLQALEKSIENQPVVDTQRVQSIRQSILDGTFNLDNRQTAEKFAEFENLLDIKSTQK